MQAKVDSWSFTQPLLDSEMIAAEEENGKQILLRENVNLKDFLAVSQYLDVNFQFCKLTKLGKRWRKGMLQSQLRYKRGPLVIHFSSDYECDTSLIEQLYDFSNMLTLKLEHKTQRTTKTLLAQYNESIRQKLKPSIEPGDKLDGKDYSYVNFDNFLQQSVNLIDYKRADLKKRFSLNLDLNEVLVASLFLVNSEHEFELAINEFVNKQVYFKNLLKLLGQLAWSLNEVSIKNIAEVKSDQRVTSSSQWQ